MTGTARQVRLAAAAAVHRAKARVATVAAEKQH
jgi:hypothetical protein